MSVESGTVALLNKSEIDMQVATAHKYPRNTCGQYIHIKTAESVLGCPLPPGAVVHHFDGNRNNNANSNLVVCPSQKYHKLLHIRTRALDECGNAEFRKCRYCKSYDDPVELFSY